MALLVTDEIPSDFIFQQNEPKIVPKNVNSTEDINSDFERLLRTGRGGTLPDRYRKRFASELAEHIFSNLREHYDRAGVDYNKEEEIEEMEEELVNRLLT